MSGGLLLLLVIGITLAPLAALARWLRIYPHRPLLYLLLIPAGLSAALIVLPTSLVNDGLIFLGAVEAALVLLLLIDVLTLPRAGQFDAQRATQRIASLVKPHQVTLTISNRAARPWTVWIKDDADSLLRPLPEDFIVALEPQSRSTLRYQLRPSRRGSFTLAAIHLQVRSRLGFWRRMFSYPSVSTINVYPDMKQLSEYAVLARTNRLSQIGVRRTRKIGQDH